MRDKYYTEPQRDSAMWARKHQPDLAVSVLGLPPQALPATMPSLDFRLVWHTGNGTPCSLADLHASFFSDLSSDRNVAITLCDVHVVHDVH